MKPPDGWKLVAGVAIMALTVIVFFWVRTWRSEQNSRDLCQKIDRFIVATESAVKASRTLTPQEKAVRLEFYERFRNDPPVCRTDG